jgi:hypothetical protein
MTLQQILLMVDSMDVVAMSPPRRHDGPPCSPRRCRPLDVLEPHDDGEKSKSSRGSALLLKTAGALTIRPAGANPSPSGPLT